jgi:polysaccharide export outer membrane protein
MKIRHWMNLLVVLALLGGTGCGMLKGKSGNFLSSKSQQKTKQAIKKDTRETAGARPPRRTHLKVSAPDIREVKDVTAYRMKPSDQIIIHLRSIPEEQRIEDVIDENGNITLDFIGDVHAAGRTTTELEQAIQRAYLDQKIYRRITVNVVIPLQSYYVRGEVRQPGRYPLVSGVTIVKAIAAAGGYTEFANPKKVTIIREGQTFVRNVQELEETPEKDEEVEAGDVIVVPRGIW